jgi:hypothetical protein
MRGIILKRMKSYETRAACYRRISLLVCCSISRCATGPRPALDSEISTTRDSVTRWASQALLNLVAYGLILGPGTYLRRQWTNVMDLTIVGLRLPRPDETSGFHLKKHPKD